NRVSTACIMLGQTASNGDSLVGGVIQHLDVQFVQWIIQPANRFQEPFHHELFVKNGKLNRDPRQLREMSRRIYGAVFPILVIKIDQHVAMHAIGGQQYQHKEIRNQQRHVEGVGVIQTLKSLVEEMLTNVLPKTARY